MDGNQWREFTTLDYKVFPQPAEFVESYKAETPSELLDRMNTRAIEQANKKSQSVASSSSSSSNSQPSNPSSDALNHETLKDVPFAYELESSDIPSRNIENSGSNSENSGRNSKYYGRNMQKRLQENRSRHDKRAVYCAIRECKCIVCNEER